MNIGFNRLYYGAAALIVFLVTFFSAQGLIDQSANLAYYNSFAPEVRYPPRFLPKELQAPPEDFELRNAKEQVATYAALVIIALPIWWFHWRRWRVLAETATPRLFRLYVYTLMVITLVTLIFRGASALGTLFQVLLGLIPLTSASALFAVSKDVVSGALDALIALAAWAFHARVSRQLENS